MNETTHWTCRPWCPRCAKAVEVRIPLGTGITEWLDQQHPCPECGKPGLRLTEKMEKPRPIPPR